jgi:hypothetical protein
MILTVPDSDAFAPLTAPIEGEAYMQLLLDRQAAYEATHPPKPDAITLRFPALLEWFIQPGDEDWVDVPETQPQPKRVATPRVYRSATSIAEELARIDARMAQIANSGPDDPAAVNISPYSRSRAARTAGRRRFAQLDRDLERYVALRKRRDALAGRLLSAQAREARAASIDESN